MNAARQIVLKHRLDGTPTPSDFEVIRHPLTNPSEGSLRVRALYLSLDPYLGPRLCGLHMGLPAPQPGEPLPGICVGIVEVSNHSGFRVGDHVVGEMGWTEVGIMQASTARKVDGQHPAHLYLGLLGVPGLTAWAGVTQLAKVQRGEVFCVDAAAGPVGGTAGQIARLLGAQTIGIAGGAKKCALVRDFYKFDTVLDHRDTDWAGQLEPAPHVHFENVGPPVLNIVLPRMRSYGRVVLCGLAGADQTPPVVSIGQIMQSRAQLMGLIVYDFIPHFQTWVKLAEDWITRDELRLADDIADGLQAAPSQLQRLLSGQTLGKALVRLTP